MLQVLKAQVQVQVPSTTSLLKSNNPSRNEATDVAQNRLLWRLMSAFALSTPSGACHTRRRRYPTLLIGRNLDDSSIVWKYVRPVDSVKAAVAHQGQDQGLELQGQDQGLSLQGQGQDKGPQFCP